MNTSSHSSPAHSDDPLTLRVAGTFSTLLDAELARSRLEAAGIDACIPEDHVYGDGPSPHGVTVHVAARDLNDARNLLRSDA
jgi:hypothetical protein